ncbi:unnamed protein product [Penicillium olsonii]|nr:unnamed protein product [Penicillium olsonii]
MLGRRLPRASEYDLDLPGNRTWEWYSCFRDNLYKDVCSPSAQPWRSDEEDHSQNESHKGLYSHFIMFISSLLAISFVSLSLAQPQLHPNSLRSREDGPVAVFADPSSTKSVMPTYTPPPPPPKTRRLGHAIVNNNCDFPVYLWSVGTNVQPVQTLNPDDSYGEIFREDPNTGGIAIKISTDVDGLYTSAPQMVFAYNLSYFKRRGDNGEKVWYDLSDVFGDPFQGYPISLTPAEPAIHWQTGVPPSGSQVRVIASWTNLTLSLC